MRSASLLFLLFFTIHFCSAQQFTLSGSIKDKRGEALPGTGIFVSGYKIATVADNNGEYQLPLNISAITATLSSCFSLRMPVVVFPPASFLCTK